MKQFHSRQPCPPGLFLHIRKQNDTIKQIDKFQFVKRIKGTLGCTVRASPGSPRGRGKGFAEIGILLFRRGQRALNQCASQHRIAFACSARFSFLRAFIVSRIVGQLFGVSLPVIGYLLPSQHFFENIFTENATVQDEIQNVPGTAFMCCAFTTIRGSTGRTNINFLNGVQHPKS